MPEPYIGRAAEAAARARHNRIHKPMKESLIYIYPVIFLAFSLAFLHLSRRFKESSIEIELLKNENKLLKKFGNEREECPQGEDRIYKRWNERLNDPEAMTTREEFGVFDPPFHIDPKSVQAIKEIIERVSPPSEELSIVQSIADMAVKRADQAEQEMAELKFSIQLQAHPNKEDYA